MDRRSSLGIPSRKFTPSKSPLASPHNYKNYSSGISSRIEKDPDCEDYSTCLIRFQAGPPYEDVAFKIVNKEWEYATKHGFKSSFERGILHLFFNFKRTRYRK